MSKEIVFGQELIRICPTDDILLIMVRFGILVTLVPLMEIFMI